MRMFSVWNPFASLLIIVPVTLAAVHLRIPNTTVYSASVSTPATFGTGAIPSGSADNANLSLGAMETNPNATTTTRPPIQRALEQSDVSETCVKFDLPYGASTRMKLLVINTKTKAEVFNQNITKIALALKEVTLCDLDLHQRYNVSLTSKRSVYSGHMWTRQVLPPAPPLPHILDVGDKTIKLLIYPVEFNLETGPFSGFDLRILKIKPGKPVPDLPLTSADPKNLTYTSSNREIWKTRIKRAPKAPRAPSGMPPGHSVGVIKDNVEQTFTIGDESNVANKPLDSDTDYVIYLGTVSTVAHRSTHAYVSLQAKTTSILMGDILGGLLIVLALLTLVVLLVTYRWRRMAKDLVQARREEEMMLMMLSDHSSVALAPPKLSMQSHGQDQGQAGAKGSQSAGGSIFGQRDVVDSYLASRNAGTDLDEAQIAHISGIKQSFHSSR